MKSGGSIVLTILIAASLAAGGPAAAPAQVPTPAAASPAAAPTPALAAPEPTALVAYGAAPSQFVEVFLPPGPGPFPVAVFIHGGCYVAADANVKGVRRSFAALAGRGVAVWGVEYRRTDEPGGAFPGLFKDIEAAIDIIPSRAAELHLDPSRMVIAGHSAGGHLALWAAGRAHLPPSSPLRDNTPLKPLAVVALAGPGDLEPIRDQFAPTCGKGVFEALTGAPTPERPDIYADTSPVRLLPLGVPTVLVAGGRDDVVPAAFVQAYAVKAKAAGDAVDYRLVPTADHIDLVRSQNPAWATSMDAIVKALAR